MRLTSVEQHGVTIAFTQEDCALLADLLGFAYLHHGGRLDRPLLGLWIDAATVAFEAAALVCAAGGIVLDSVAAVTPEDRAGFTVEAIRRQGEALSGPTAAD